MDNTIVDRMQAMIEDWESAGDHRAIFLTCYVMMTRNMLEAVDHGRFEDVAWVSHLLHHFANFYFNALQAYEDPQGDPPLVWQLAFDAARSSRTHAMQNLVLGVNAHINFDLVFALVDLLGPEWSGLSEEKRLLRYRDHCLVNDIISQTIDSVQDQVIERYSTPMELVDALLGPLDEWMTARLISGWRDQVWSNATRLIEINDEDGRQNLLQEVENTSTDRARILLGEEGLSGLLDL